MRCIVVDGKRYEIEETKIVPKHAGVDERGIGYIKWNPKDKVAVATERK